MRKLLLGCAVVFFCVLTAGAGAASAQQNPLLGKWKLLKGDAGCYTELQFTRTTQTLIMKADAPLVTTVTYNAGPTQVYVIGNTGLRGAVGYDIVGGNQIKLHSWVNCLWQRA